MKFAALVLGAVVFLILFFLLNPKFFYNIGIFIYYTAIRIASLWNKKARAWLAGRKNIFESLEQNFQYPGHKKIWMHCASLGEFEQGRPLLELMKKQYPEHKILLTFFSPSGYTVQQHYPGADHVSYLPLDTKANAGRFMDIVQPDIAIFVKYEFWLHFIESCSNRKIPLYLISSRFKKRSVFFRWYGRLFRSMLRKFTFIYVQTNASLALLQKIKIQNTAVAADTRFDRVMEIANHNTENDAVKKFVRNFNVIVAGSTWKVDEQILQQAFYKNLIYSDFKLIVAPHEITEQKLKKTGKRFKKDAITYSELLQADALTAAKKRVLIMDNIGMLSSLYKYADICYVGGGFNKGIHNVLEAAVYGKPVLFGGKYKKFNEAVELLDMGAAFCVWNAEDILKDVGFMGNFDDIYKGACKNAEAYVRDNSGGTEKIFEKIRVSLV